MGSQTAMEPIYIPQLTKAPERTEVIPFREMLPEIETLTPVQGKMQITHHGNYLEVIARAETIITLTCHRCLQQYNSRLTINTSELIWLTDDGDMDPDLIEQEGTLEDLVETLPRTGYFDPTTWLYEQLCLEIPQRQLCGQTCSGIPAPAEEPTTAAPIDQRWASLEALRARLPGQ